VLEKSLTNVIIQRNVKSPLKMMHCCSYLPSLELLHSTDTRSHYCCSI